MNQAAEDVGRTMETTTRLTKEQYLATMREPMTDAMASATNVIDIWPYVDSVPRSDWEGHKRLGNYSDHYVEDVRRSGDGHFDHVLVMTDAKNVYLVIVVDVRADKILGHHLLDLNREYGLKEPTA